MKVYISGAITGTNDFMERFQKAEDELKKMGHKVYNPAHANSYMPEGTTHEQYMAVSFLLLGMADAIYLLKGWEKSRGANMEYGYAIAKNKKIIMEE